VEIRGSDVWPSSGFSRVGATMMWRSSNTYPVVGTSSEPSCENGPGNMCKRREQVFLDGEQLIQKPDGGDPAANEFTLDGARHVILGTDPAGKTVEVSVRRHALQISAPNVTIRNLKAQHSTSTLVQVNAHDDWRVENSDLAYAHDEGFRASSQASGTLINADIHHNGRIGATGGNSRHEQVGGECYRNGYGDGRNWALPTWHSGCMKWFAERSILIEGVHSHHNNGNGLWTDGGNGDIYRATMNGDRANGQFNVIFRNNITHHNANNGLKCEITLNCDIYGNVIYSNGTEAGSESGAGIIASGSSFGRIHDNVIAWNGADAIRIHNVLRSDHHSDQGSYDQVREMRVYHNDIFTREPQMGLAWRKQWSGGKIFDAEMGNEGYGNRFYFAAADGSPDSSENAARFAWAGNYQTLSSFNNTPGEEGGSYMTEQEKDDVLSASGVSFSPEC
jgi:hypothetical protein